MYSGTSELSLKSNDTTNTRALHFEWSPRNAAHRRIHETPQTVGMLATVRKMWDMVSRPTVRTEQERVDLRTQRIHTFHDGFAWCINTMDPLTPLASDKEQYNPDDLIQAMNIILGSNRTRGEGFDRLLVHGTLVSESAPSTVCNVQYSISGSYQVQGDRLARMPPYTLPCAYSISMRCVALDGGELYNVQWRIRMQRASETYPDSLRQIVRDSLVDVNVNDVLLPYIDLDVDEAKLWLLDGTYVHEMCRAINDNFTIACTEPRPDTIQKCRRVQVTSDAPGARLALARRAPPEVNLALPQLELLIETETLFRMAMLAEQGRGVLFLQSKRVENNARGQKTRRLSSARVAFYQKPPKFDATFEVVLNAADAATNDWIVTLTAAPGTVLLADTPDANVDKYAWKPNPGGEVARNIVKTARGGEDVQAGGSRKRSADSTNFTREEIRGLFDEDDAGKPRSSEASSTDTRDTLPIPLRIELHIRRMTDDEDETVTFIPQQMKVGGWFFKDRASPEFSRDVINTYEKHSTNDAERKTLMKKAMVRCTRMASAYGAAVTQEPCIVAFGAVVIGGMQTALENVFSAEQDKELDGSEHNDFRTAAMQMLEGVSETVPETIATYGANPIAQQPQRETKFNTNNQFVLETTEAYLGRV